MTVWERIGASASTEQGRDGSGDAETGLKTGSSVQQDVLQHSFIIALIPPNTALVNSERWASDPWGQLVGQGNHI